MNEMNYFPNDKFMNEKIDELYNRLSITREILLLSGKDIKNLINMEEAVCWVEDYWKKFSEQISFSEDKIIIDIQNIGDFRFMPADDGKYINSKLLGAVDNNPKRGIILDGINALIDRKHVNYVCMSDANYLTNIRTGAAGGIAVKYLARTNSKTLGVVGSGNQARSQTEAVLQVLKNKIKTIFLYDIRKQKSNDMKKELEKKQLDIEVVISSEPSQLVNNSDILVTCTPSRTPIILDSWVKEGTHINAIGADAEGKQELDSKLLKRGKIVVDNIAQTCTLGEINVPIKNKEITKNNIYSTLGEIITKKKLGRENDQEITIFDSTGLCIQDLAVERLVFEKALYLRVTKGEKIGVIYNFETGEFY
jgi:alanine dehydrogenase